MARKPRTSSIRKRAKSVSKRGRRSVNNKASM